MSAITILVLLSILCFAYNVYATARHLRAYLKASGAISAKNVVFTGDARTRAE